MTGSELNKFFERPIAVFSTEWLQGSISNDVLYSFSIGAALEAQPLWAQKYQGFRYVRGTAVIRVQINPMPFHQGRLLLHFLPFVSHMPAKYVTTHNWCLGNKTAQPCVELDCRDGSAEIEVPYVAPTQYYDLLTNTYDWGTFYLSVLSPLVSPDVQSVEYTVWLSFKDFELAAPIVPQSARSGPKVRNSKIKKLNMHSAEKKSVDQQGILQKSANAVKGVADSLTGIPMLSSIVTPVSWMAGAVSSVAGVFGWSKPLSEQATTIVLARNAHAMTNSIGHDTSESLAYFPDPSIQASDCFAGSNVDEMSFAYLKQFDTYATSFTWSTMDASGDVVYSTNLSLNTMGQITTTPSAPGFFTLLSPPPMLAIAKKFRYYRGGIRLTLKFIKTQYHSGRLSITFVPGANFTVNPTNVTASYVLREIVDMRDSSELVLELPYLLNKPYAVFEENFGSLQIAVLNELRAASTVNSSIQVLAYYGVAEDFECTVPEPSGQRAIHPQMADLDSSTLVAAKVIGGANSNSVDFARPALCVGETVVSLKQMLLRYQRIYRDVGGFTAGYIYPFIFSLCTVAAAGDTTPPQWGGDYMNDIASGYALYRGGMRLLFQPDNPDSITYASPVVALRVFDGGSVTYDASTTEQSLTTATNLTSTSTWASTVQHTGQVEFSGNECPLINVTVPYYNNYPSSLVIPVYATNASVPSDLSQPPYGISFNPGVPAATCRGYRAAADDFQFGYFIGFPPQIINYVP